MNLKHPATIYSLVEAIVATACLFLPLSGPQVAAILGVVAMLTGQQVKRKNCTLRKRTPSNRRAREIPLPALKTVHPTRSTQRVRWKINGQDRGEEEVVSQQTSGA